jgi:hypothetical protein
MAGKPWTEEELFYLKGHYGKVSIQKIARQLQRSYQSVQHKAQTEKLTKPAVTRKPWSDKELQILERNYEKKGATYVAKRLKRSLISVKRKAQHLGLNSYQIETLSLRTLADSFRSDPSVIHRWIRQGLPHRTYPRGQLTIYCFDQDEFWEWAKTHTTLIPWQKYVAYSLLPEPPWIKPLIKQAFSTRNRSPITTSEIQQVLRARQTGMSFAQIANELHRTENSVKHIWRKHRPKN